MDLSKQLDCPSEFLYVPYAQSYYHMVRAEFDLAQRLDQALLHLSNQREDAAGLFLGHSSSGRTLMITGSFSLSRSHLEAAPRFSYPAFRSALVHQTGIDPQVTAQAYLGVVLFCLGFPDRALAQCSAAIAEARTLTHPPSLAASLTIGARLLLLYGHDAALSKRAGELTAVALEQGFASWGALGAIYRGWVKVKNGNASEGISVLRSGVAAFRAAGAEAWTPWLLSLLAEGYELGGEIAEALAQWDEALQIAERTGERWFEAELYRHKGQLLLRQGHAAAAEELYCKALTIAQEQEAKLWELRAAASLARLWRDQGRCGESRNLLTPVYGWFTEGFDTSDLKDAKALLDELVASPGPTSGLGTGAATHGGSRKSLH
jgi:predicted ATPase